MTRTLTSKIRTRAIKEMTHRTWDGTAPLMTVIAEESQYGECWRPVRAAAALALAARDVEPGHVWMTTDEFRHFLDKVIGRGRKQGTGTERLMEMVSIGYARRHYILNGSPIHKVEALACAHASLGLPLPIPAEQHALFGAWLHEFFGEVAPVAAALEVDPRTLHRRVAGFSNDRGVRRACEPEAQIIRAMDWLWRVGNVSPFGKRPLAPPFPSQSEVT